MIRDPEEPMPDAATSDETNAEPTLDSSATDPGPPPALEGSAAEEDAGVEDALRALAKAASAGVAYVPKAGRNVPHSAVVSVEHRKALAYRGGAHAPRARTKTAPPQDSIILDCTVPPRRASRDDTTAPPSGGLEAPIVFAPRGRPSAVKMVFAVAGGVLVALGVGAAVRWAETAQAPNVPRAASLAASIALQEVAPEAAASTTTALPSVASASSAAIASDLQPKVLAHSDADPVAPQVQVAPKPITREPPRAPHPATTRSIDDLVTAP